MKCAKRLNVLLGRSGIVFILDLDRFSPHHSRLVWNEITGNYYDYMGRIWLIPITGRSLERTLEMYKTTLHGQRIYCTEAIIITA